VVIGHEKALFDIILLGAPVVGVPCELLEQIGIGPRLVTRGDEKQELVLFERSAAEVRSRRLCRVKFVPLRPLT
jgi:protein-L-isoaspartate O-methyltransferase